MLFSFTGGPGKIVNLDKRDDVLSAEGSANDNSNSGGNPFAYMPSLLLAAPLATSLAESLRYLRQETMQLQTA